MPHAAVLAVDSMEAAVEAPLITDPSTERLTTDLLHQLMTPATFLRGPNQ
jgi:hypothetical protein